jgi:hypothetical protein
MIPMSLAAAAPAGSSPRAKWVTRLGLAVMTAARFLLALGMLPYGVSKLCDFQFQVGASNYAQPLGEASGKILTWAFLGYSPAFQVILGGLETLPAILLLFARTRRLGALLLLPVLLNVVSFNYFLDLWPDTQLIGSVLLALNLFLIIYDYRIYLDFLSRLLERPVPIANRKLRMASKIAGFVVPATVIVAFLYSFQSQIAAQSDPLTDFIGRRQINRAGSWTIESMRVAGQPVIGASGAELYFDFTRRYFLDLGGRKESGTFEANKSNHDFQIRGLSLTGAGAAVQGSYKVDGDRLFLDGHSGNRPVSFVLERDKWGRMFP